MVKIIYGEHSQQADLAGKSVAEVRELYKSEFTIPDRAQASLNGQQLKKKLEPETRLSDEDKLSFEEKSRRGLVLLGAFLLTLAVTGALFAYTQTTATITIGTVATEADFGTVNATAETPPATYNVLGRVRGKIGAGTLFDISKHTAYTGDIEVQVYLANSANLSGYYSFWMLQLQLLDVDGDWMATDNHTHVLSLNNPSVTFSSTNESAAFPAYVECMGGSYRTFGHVLWHGGTPADPLIFCKIIQGGAH